MVGLEITDTEKGRLFRDSKCQNVLGNCTQFVKTNTVQKGKE